VGYLTVINVTDFGAVGDGLTDDTVAINSALMAVPSGGPLIQGGAIVYFPAGTYMVSSPLVRQVSYTRCVGEGKDATTVKLAPTSWTGAPSMAEPDKSFIFDLLSYDVNGRTVPSQT